MLGILTLIISKLNSSLCSLQQRKGHRCLAVAFGKRKLNSLFIEHNENTYIEKLLLLQTQRLGSCSKHNFFPGYAYYIDTTIF